jgi:hypothetical protein
MMLLAARERNSNAGLARKRVTTMRIRFSIY